ncbi:MAG: hypothetical protein G01um1014106_747, partial [Parcubacteria group bacterium Gr01-1014_106]
IADILQMLRTRRKRMPSQRTVRALLSAYARESSADAGILVWLSLLATAAEDADLDEVLRQHLKKPTSRVFPFAVFS